MFAKEPVPNVPNAVPNVPNKPAKKKATDGARVAKWKQSNLERYNAYQREYMKRRAHA